MIDAKKSPSGLVWLLCRIRPSFLAMHAAFAASFASVPCFMASSKSELSLRAITLYCSRTRLSLGSHRPHISEVDCRNKVIGSKT